MEAQQVHVVCNCNHWQSQMSCGKAEPLVLHFTPEDRQVYVMLHAATASGIALFALGQLTFAQQTAGRCSAT